jgi:hypothetical protein
VTAYADDRSWPVIPDPDGQPDDASWVVVVGTRRARGRST